MTVQCLVKDGVVVNRVNVGPDWTPPSGFALVPGDGNIGDLWSDGVFTTPVRVPTAENYEAAIQAKIDAVAQAKSYRDGFALATYATSTVFGADAQAFIPWRDQVWTYAYAQLAAVLAGQRTQPTVEEFIDEIKTQHPAPWPV